MPLAHLCPLLSIRRSLLHSCAVLVLLSNTLVLPSARSADEMPSNPHQSVLPPSPTPSKHPTTRPAPYSRKGFTSSIHETTTAALFTILSAGAGLFLARRFLPRAPHRPNPLRILHRLPLSSRHSLAIVQVAGRDWVLGLGPAGPPTLLGTLDGTPFSHTESNAQATPASPARPAWLHPILMGGSLPR